MADFYKDLRYGQEAEKKFLKQYGEFLEALDGREGDFKIKGTNLKIELKTDKYDHEEYPNFIIERYRSGKKDGGPWQSLGHGCRYYAYWFAGQDRLYFMDVYRLCRRVIMLVKKHKFPLEQISNISYNTSYYRIPRELCKDLFLEYHAVVERKYNLAQKRKAKSGKEKV